MNSAGIGLTAFAHGPTAALQNAGPSAGARRPHGEYDRQANLPGLEPSLAQAAPQQTPGSRAAAAFLSERLPFDSKPHAMGLVPPAALAADDDSKRWLKPTLTGVQSHGTAVGATTLRQEIGLGSASRIVRGEFFRPKSGKTQVIERREPDRTHATHGNQPKVTEVRPPAFPRPTGDGEHQHHPHHAAIGSK